MRLFYVLYIKKAEWSECVEAIRLLSNPAEKFPAHVTVRGPYRKPISIKRVRGSRQRFSVVVDQVGNFFRCGQNTVFFSCQTSGLKNVWFKPDYPYNPHLTIYDGSSAQFAKSLYKVLHRYKYCLTFTANGLEPLKSLKGQRSFDLTIGLDTDRISKLLDEPFDPSTVAGLSRAKRLRLIDKLCQHLAKVSDPGPLFAHHHGTGNGRAQDQFTLVH